MKKFIRMMEEQKVDESLLKLAPFALANYRKDSFDRLSRLCEGDQKLMAAVLAGVIVLWLISKFHKRCRQDLQKKQRRLSSRELNQYLDSIQLVARLGASVDQQTLRVKAIDFLSDRPKREQDLSRDLNESEREHQNLLGQLAAAIRSGTGRGEDAICRQLSGFLNSIGFTMVDRKPFTPRNIIR